MKLKQLGKKIETIGDYKFYISPFPAFKAAKMSGELASMLAPLVSLLLPLVGDGEDLMDIDITKAAGALSVCSIDGNKLEVLMKSLLLGGHISVEYVDEDNGEMVQEVLDQDICNEIFCGSVEDMFKLCFYVVRLNYNSFFGSIANLSGKAALAETQRTII